MKITVDNKSFVDAISWVVKNYDNRDENGYVKFVLDEETGTGFLSVNSNNAFMKASFDVIGKIKREASDPDSGELVLLVDGNTLQRLPMALNAKSTVNPVITYKSNASSLGSLKVSLGKSGNVTLPLVDGVPFNEPKYHVIGEVNDNDLFDSLKGYAKLSDPANTGAISFIGCVDIGFDKENSTMSLFATDRYTMGEIILPYEPTNDEKYDNVLNSHILLPYAAAVMVPPTKGSTVPVQMIMQVRGDKVIRFGYDFPDDRLALFGVMDAEPFGGIEKMKKVAADSVDDKIIVNRSELMNAIKIVSNLAWGDNDIYFTFGGDTLIVEDKLQDNDIEVSLESKGSGDHKRRIRLLRTIISDALSPISTSKVEISWGDNSKSISLTPITDSGDKQDNVFLMAVITN